MITTKVYIWSLQENYNLLPETIDKVIVRKKAFVDENPEIMNNELYQDQKVNIEVE